LPWLEDKLAQPDAPANWRRDLLGVALLAGLMAILLPGWWPHYDVESRRLLTDVTGLTATDVLQDIEGHRRLTDVAGQMGSAALLMAMGWLVALRRGAIDLSVWVVAGVAGTVAAAAISVGVPPLLAFVIVASLGWIIGLVNGLLVALARVPSVVATLVVGLAVMWVAQGCFEQRTIEVPQDAFFGWMIVASVESEPTAENRTNGEPPEQVEETVLPLTVTRIMIVLGLYAAVMFLAVGRRHGWSGRRPDIVWSLTVSGALAALAGACLLMDHGMASVPTRPIGDLRIPAAVVLAGSWFLVGPHRGKLAGLCMPIALLAVTIWQQRVWLLGTMGYEWQLLLLTGLAVVYHLACRGVFAWPGRLSSALAKSAAAFIGGGMALLAATTTTALSGARGPCRTVALAICAVGAAALLAGYRAARRLSSTSCPHGDVGTRR